MVDGVPGVPGVLVVLPVEEEINRLLELVQTQVLQMEELLVLVRRLNLNLVIRKDVRWIVLVVGELVVMVHKHIR